MIQRTRSCHRTPQPLWPSSVEPATRTLPPLQPPWPSFVEPATMTTATTTTATTTTTTTAATSNKQQATSNPPTPNKEQPTTSNQQRETISDNHYNNFFFHSGWGEKNTHLQRQRLKLHSAPFPQFQCWSPRNRWPLTGMGVFFTTACPPTPAATLKLGCRGFGHCFVALSGDVCFFHPNRYPSRLFFFKTKRVEIGFGQKVAAFAEIDAGTCVTRNV